MKKIIWGFLLFVFEIFILYEDYTKNFIYSVDTVLIISIIFAFIMGALHSNKYRKIEFASIVTNSLFFSFLTCLFFYLYLIEVNYKSFLSIFLVTFIAMYLGNLLFGVLFLPINRYAKKNIKK